MKKTISIFLTLVMIAVCYYAVKKVEKALADEPECTACAVWCFKDGDDCKLNGQFCLDSSNVNTPYFWYAHVNGGGYTRVTMQAIVFPCDDGCTSWGLTYYPIVTCGEGYIWRVTWGDSVDDPIACESDPEVPVTCPK